MHCILRNKIKFIGQIGWNYIHIHIKDKGFVVEELSRQDAHNIIDDYNLQCLFTSNYGMIYAIPEFKDYINNHYSLKQSILSLLEQIDNGKN